MSNLSTVAIEPSIKPKVCNICGEKKPYDSFHIVSAKVRKNGKRVVTRRNACSLCRYKKDKKSGRMERRRADPKIREKMREYDRSRRADPVVAEKRRAQDRERGKRPEFKERRREYYKRWYRVPQNKHSVLSAAAQRNRDGVRDISDSYIKHLITKDTNLAWADVPAEVVEVKRLQIKIQREVKRRTTYA